MPHALRYNRALGLVNAVADDSCKKWSRIAAAPTAIMMAAKLAMIKARTVFSCFSVAAAHAASVKASVSMSMKIRPTAPTRA